MTIGEVEELFAYGAWANGRLFAMVATLSEEQLSTPAASSFSSIRATLGHIVAAEWIWHRRLLGESPSVAPPWMADSTVARLREHLATVEAERAEYLARLQDADLDRRLQYRSLDGAAHDDRLGGILRHVVNHSTYHRGQAATQLRQLGQAPPNTDLINYLRQVT